MKIEFFFITQTVVLLLVTSVTTAQVNISVDQNTCYQVIDGFGATTSPLVYGTNDYITAYRDSATKLLYRDVKLNMGNISCGTFEAPTGSGGPSANDNSDPFIEDQNGFDWQYVENQKTKIIDYGSPYGFNDWYLEPKISTRWDWTGEWLRDLKAIDYNLYIDECAEHVVAALKFFRDSLGIVQPYVMPFNEALSGNGELDNGTYQEVKDILIAVGQRMELEGFGSTKLQIGNEERPDFSYNLLSFLLADTALSKYVGAIGYHPYPYGSQYASINNILDNPGQGQPVQAEIDIRQDLYNLAQQYGVKLWMTEVSNGWIGGVEGNLPIDSVFSMLHVRGRAIHIHDEFKYATANAYFGMNALWDYDSHVDHFGTGSNFYQEDGTFVLIDQRDGGINLTGMAHAVGHYSRWITPRGTWRTESASDDSLIMVTSMIDTITNKTVLVVINNKSSSETINVRLQQAINDSISGEVSYSAVRWQTITPFAASGTYTFSHTLPGESVATYVISTGNTTAVQNISGNSTNTNAVIYPNPTNSYFSFNISGLKQSEKLNLSIVDIKGSVVFRVEYTAPSDRITRVINISNLSSGIYFVIFNTETTMQTHKLVILK
jgi:Secretion system C-terminal sorting domain